LGLLVSPGRRERRSASHYSKKIDQTARKILKVGDEKLRWRCRTWGWMRCRLGAEIMHPDMTAKIGQRQKKPPRH